TGSVSVFDADTNEVLGTINIPTAVSGLGDAVITSDQTRAFVSGIDTQFIYVIDLTTSPPSLAGGTNPITLSHNGLDLALSADDKFLLVAGGAQSPNPISVIDLATLAEVSTFSTGAYANAIDVCEDGLVLVTSPTLGEVSLFRMDVTGSVVNVVQQPFIGYPINVYCAPGSKSGVAVDGLGSVQSFALPGLTQVGIATLSTASGQSGGINAAGDRVYIRSDPFLAVGTIDAFAFDSTTGAIAVSPLFTIPIQGQWQINGVDQLAISPDGSKLFVVQPSAVNVYDAGNGTLLSTITDPNIVDPAGVAIAHPRLAPFSKFTAKVEINTQTAKIEGNFTLGQNNNGINPSMEGVTFQVGPVSKTIPPGSFKVNPGTGGFTFKGAISGNKVNVTIQPTRILGQFRYLVEVVGIDLTTIPLQVNVSLTIGNDGGNSIAANKSLLDTTYEVRP
ncbi:MAG TPA: hypothetical protein VLM91_06250, partial [Candidatus Methylomirabilis sp.]|nr:hypothetical protein [Candidatus Methylomirabilis sp.]